MLKKKDIRIKNIIIKNSMSLLPLFNIKKVYILYLFIYLSKKEKR